VSAASAKRRIDDAACQVAAPYDQPAGQAVHDHIGAVDGEVDE
jgi:hypothetical protein